ncbi:TetR/AcrR family transcriptional regulator [Microcella alkalica]
MLSMVMSLRNQPGASSPSRAAIVDRARRLAAVEGLDGLSLARLAHDLGMSKSGVVALFGSKEALQLATVSIARDVFVEEVVAPVLSVAGGLDRLRALLESHVRYSEARRESGGCFFAATSSEFAGRPSSVRDAILAARAEWDAVLLRIVERAIGKGDLDPDTDAEQLAYQLRALLEAASTDALRLGTAEPHRRTRIAIEAVLRSAGAP